MDDLKSTSTPVAPVTAYAPPAQPDSVEARKKQKRKLGLIIGLSVGIPVVVIAVLILVFIFSPQIMGMSDRVNDAIANGDARNIAVAVNIYNALNSDADPIDTKEELAAAAVDGQNGVLGSLWPEGIADVDTALALIEFENGSAIVVTPAD